MSCERERRRQKYLAKQHGIVERFPSAKFWTSYTYFELWRYLVKLYGNVSSYHRMCSLTAKFRTSYKYFELGIFILLLLIQGRVREWRRQRERERERERERGRDTSSSARHRRALSECKFLISNLVLFLFYYYSYRSGSGRESGRDISWSSTASSSAFSLLCRCRTCNRRLSIFRMRYCCRMCSLTVECVLLL